MHRSATLLVLLAVATAGLPRGGLAQVDSRREPSDPLLYWGVDVSLATVSALVQGRGGDDDGILRRLAGAVVGGTVMYAGQRLVGTGDPRLRLAGLETVAVGASVVGNVARGDAPLAHLTLPFVPFYVGVHPGTPNPVEVRLSATALVMAVRMALQYHALPDWGTSLVSGALVYRPEGEYLACRAKARGWCSWPVLGVQSSGVVVVADDVQEGVDATLTHELGHAAQDLRDAVLFALPASDGLLDRGGAVGRALRRVLVLDLVRPAASMSWAAGTSGGRHCGAASFFECEVEALSGR